MENREILIANTRTQKRSKLVTNATTLGELKTAMDAAGIDYSNMTFTEGISKTQLLNNDTQLPTNVRMIKKIEDSSSEDGYRTEEVITNNLIILLTDTKKNIASGCTGSRSEAKELIASVEGLKEEIKRISGKNWTIVPTSVLWEIITAFCPDAVDEEEDEDIDDEQHNLELHNEDTEDEEVCPVCAIIDSISVQVAALASIGVIGVGELQTLSRNINMIIEKETSEETEEEKHTAVSTSDGKITDEDIDNILDDLGM